MADTTRSRVRAWITASRALGVVRALKPAPIDRWVDPPPSDLDDEEPLCLRFPYPLVEQSVEERVLASLGETTEVLGDPWVAALVVFGGGAGDVDAVGKASRSVVERVAP